MTKLDKVLKEIEDRRYVDEVVCSCGKDVPRLTSALRRAVECMEYCLGPTRDIKGFQIKEALADIEKIMGGEDE